MEDDNRREENNEVTAGVEEAGTAGQQERGSDNQYQQITRPLSSSRKCTRDDIYVHRIDSRQHDRKPSRSRSRSRSRSSKPPPRRRQWRSANAFLNFMQDFRQEYNKLKAKDLFRLGGQAWRQMSSADKMPYVEAAKQQSQNNKNNKNAQQNKPNSSDSSKKADGQKDQKKKEREERKERRRSRSRGDDSDAESDSATSGTGATMTSDDVSDLSS
ncbi:DNA-binding protein MNB1B-like [Temnothorax curvispinosus]|uniref:DNA-binding protein MNB1B-like n=1 Tax=Temnothorax curvispinosus TaxID=300111 RepID=A0A6J1Q648_9HYME|nr:DNA-binding protein MNB1B-like [Temnothorax curvispinosus]